MRYAVKNVGESLTFHEGPLEYEDMRRIVGGYLEVFPLPNGLTLWLNEEGKLIDLPPNFVLNGVGWQEWIVGNVFFTGGADEEGETMGLDPAQEEFLRQMFSRPVKAVLL